MKSLSETTPNDPLHTPCPVWVAYLFDNPLRSLLHPAKKILAPYVRPGMTVLDFGCGFGHYARGMAALTGPSGTVWIADVQEKMLEKTLKRAEKDGFKDRFRTHVCREQGFKTAPESFDFILCSNVVHEIPDAALLLKDFFSALKPGGTFFFMEPVDHVKAAMFEKEMDLAINAGFTLVETPAVKREYTALFKKQ